MSIYIAQVKDLQSSLDSKLSIINNGIGLVVDNLKWDLDIDTKTLVQPVITPDFTFKDQLDNTIFNGVLLNHDVTVDVGTTVNLLAHFSYPIKTSIENYPITVSGSWGSELPLPNINSTDFIQNNIQTDFELLVNLERVKTGLMIDSNNKLTTAIGTEVKTDKWKIYFKHKFYFGTSIETSILNDNVKLLSNKQYCKDKENSFTNITTLEYEYLYYCYPAEFGDLTGIILNIAGPILGAFTKILQTSVTNDAGLIVLYNVYRSNAPGAFLNDAISFM